MSGLILAFIYVLAAIGVYRANMRDGFKPDITWRVKTKTRLRMAWYAAIWPYLFAYNSSKPRVYNIY